MTINIYDMDRTITRGGTWTPWLLFWVRREAPWRVVLVPLTSNTGRAYPGEAVVTVEGQASKAMDDQIMTADKLRLQSKLGELLKSDMQT